MYRTWESTGISQSGGFNRPILSAHTGGVNTAFGDGSVRFLTNSTNLQTLYNLSNKDDGNPVNLP